MVKRYFPLLTFTLAPLYLNIKSEVVCRLQSLSANWRHEE